MLQSSQAVTFTEIDVDGHLVWHEPGGLRKVCPLSGTRSMFLRGRAAVPPHVNDWASSEEGPDTTGVGAAIGRVGLGKRGTARPPHKKS